MHPHGDRSGCTCKCVAIGTALTREAVMTDGAEARSRVHRPAGIRAAWPVAAGRSSARSCPAPGGQRLATWLVFTDLSRVVGSFHYIGLSRAAGARGWPRRPDG